jgi:hypothetical protein
MCELADASLVTAMSATPHSGGWFCTAGFGRPRSMLDGRAYMLATASERRKADFDGMAFRRPITQSLLNLAMADKIEGH